MRRFVISDIHGCYATFMALLEKIGFCRDDELYLLGDYIDRGVNSSGVLEEIIKLQEKNFKVFPLRGNHEENILNAEKEYDRPTFMHYVKRINNSPDLLEDDGSLKTRYRDFFSSLPYYYLLEDYILVHAGLNTSLEDPYQDTISMLELRYFDSMEENPAVGDRRIIHGHVPTPLAQIQDCHKNGNRIIPLDNGCVYTKKHRIFDYTTLGNLLCLELNSFELYIQKNID